MNDARDVRLSQHFCLGEFLVSEHMPEIMEYVPTAQEVANITRVAGKLQQIRDHFEQPVTINSGGRPDAVVRQSDGKTFYEVLRAAGMYPSNSSQHRFFCAADFTVRGVGLWDVYEYILSLGGFSQVILYLTEACVTRFIHLGVPDYDTSHLRGKLNYGTRLLSVGEGYYAYKGVRVTNIEQLEK